MISVASLDTLDAIRLAMILKETATPEQISISSPQKITILRLRMGITVSMIYAKI